MVYRGAKWLTEHPELTYVNAQTIDIKLKSVTIPKFDATSYAEYGDYTKMFRIAWRKKYPPPPDDPAAEPEEKPTEPLPPPDPPIAEVSRNGSIQIHTSSVNSLLKTVSEPEPVFLASHTFLPTERNDQLSRINYTLNEWLEGMSDTIMASHIIARRRREEEEEEQIPEVQGPYQFRKTSEVSSDQEMTMDSHEAARICGQNISGKNHILKKCPTRSQRPIYSGIHMMISN